MVSTHRPIRAGLTAAALWVGVEIGVLVAMALLLIGLSIPLRSGTAYRVERAATILIDGILGMIFLRRVARENLSGEELGYTPISRPIVAIGVILAALVFMSVVFVSQPLDAFLFPDSAGRESAFLRSLREGGWLAAVLLLPGNGILTPIVEEYAWRGYIQTRFVQGFGLRIGVIVTALLFAAKHIAADVSLFRLATVVLGAFALGLIRTRWGTTASTITHLCVNFVATSLAIGHVFVGESRNI